MRTILSFWKRARGGKVGSVFGLTILAWTMVEGQAVTPPLSAVVQPALTNAFPSGGDITFCVQASGGPPLLYQWRKNGVNLPGETNICLTLTNFTIGDGGSYRALVYNEEGAVLSEEGILSIIGFVQTGGDDVVDAFALFGTQGDIRGDNSAATREVDEPVHAGQMTSNSVWYSWTVGTAIATLDTRGSTFDTVLAVYTNDSQGVLQEVASNDDSGGFKTSQVQFNGQPFVTYLIAVDGLAGEAGEYILNWNVEVTSKKQSLFTTLPQPQAVPWGSTAQFQGAATDFGLGNLRFQWFRNNILIPGATNALLMVENVRAANLGNYTLAVTNFYDKVTISPPVGLEIGPDPTVRSADKIGELPDATFLTGGSAGFFSLSSGAVIQQTFNNAGSANDACEPPHCGVPGGASRWFQVRPEQDGICVLDTQGSEADTILAVYLDNRQPCTLLFEPLITCNHNTVGPCETFLSETVPLDRTSKVSFQARSNSVYRVVVDTLFGQQDVVIRLNMELLDEPLVNPGTATLGNQGAYHMQSRGQHLVLGLDPGIVPPNASIQWQRNDRSIPEAKGETLVLSFMNFSDAGRYTAQIQSAAGSQTLPGLLVMVVDACRDLSLGGGGGPVMPPPMLLLGSSPESIILEATDALSSTNTWETLNTFQGSSRPAVWNATSRPSRFFRVRSVP